MEFNHVFEAIDYAKRTGDVDSCNQYINKRLNEAGMKIRGAMEGPVAGDSVYFLMAYMQAMVDATKAAMTPQDCMTIDNLAKQISITVIKIDPFQNLREGQ